MRGDLLSHHARCLQDVNKCCRWVCLPQKSLRRAWQWHHLSEGFWKEKEMDFLCWAPYHLLLSEAPPLHFTLPCLAPLCFTPGLKSLKRLHMPETAGPHPHLALQEQNGGPWQMQDWTWYPTWAEKYTPLVRGSDLWMFSFIHQEEYNILPLDGKDTLV